MTSCDVCKVGQADFSEERKAYGSEERRLQASVLGNASAVLGSKEYLKHTLRVLSFQVQLLSPIGKISVTKYVHTV